VIVDAHHHFWDPSRADYAWMSAEPAAIRRPFGPNDLGPVIAATGVDRTVLVQTRASVDETREFLATATETPFVAGVVGWLDLTDPGIVEAIAALREMPGGEDLVAIRHQIHDEPDADWILRSEVLRGIRAVGEAGLAYDLLVRPRELRPALAAVRALPSVRFVIDHIAKPPIREGALQPWADLIAPFGELPNVWCKVSGMITEADWTGWRPGDLEPYVRHVLGVFGPKRLLFGSDWPVCLVAGSYQQVFDAARSALADLSPAELDRVFGSNAIEVYRLRV
jgi:L-fuconolactonase